MDYASKVIYNGTIVDVADIVCPGTEIAHESIGNLIKRMDNFSKNINDFKLQLTNMDSQLKADLEVVKATLESNAKKYESTITTRFNSEQSKYTLLYNHANELITNATTAMNNLETKYSHVDEDITQLQEAIGFTSVIDATIADQTIRIKEHINTLHTWINALKKAVVDNDKTDINKLTDALVDFEEAELKYDEIADLTDEWKDYLTDYHPNKQVDIDEWV